MMRKIDFAGNILIVLGFLAVAVALFVFMWPLWVGIAALFVASRLISFFNDKKEVMAKKITQVIAGLRPQPQPVSGELIDLSESTTAR